MSLTAEEKELLDLTGDVWNKFIKLPPVHPDELTEFRHKLHDIQTMILSRPGQREIGIVYNKGNQLKGGYKDGN